jgi:hypothetical protein
MAFLGAITGQNSDIEVVPARRANDRLRAAEPRALAMRVPETSRRKNPLRWIVPLAGGAWQEALPYARRGAEIRRAKEKSGGARRDLEDLRAAINHHASENLHHGVVKVKLPEKGKTRDRWLERSEAAHLLWAAWRHKEEQTIHRGKNKGIKIKTGKHTLRHVARFILIGLYTGIRASAIAAASPRKKEGHAYVDLDRGLYHRLAIGRRATNKRQPTVPLPDRLLIHMRRWYDKKIIANYFVEWQGAGVKSVKNGFARAVEVAKLDLSRQRHAAHATPYSSDLAHAAGH